jgi:hypothetical protein
MAPVKQLPSPEFRDSPLDANERYERAIAEWRWLREECTDLRRESTELLERLRKSR